MNYRNLRIIGSIAGFSTAVFLSAVLIFVLFYDRYDMLQIASTGYPIVLVLMVTALSFLIYRSFPKGQPARYIWRGLTVAFGLWALGDVTWTIQEFVLKEEELYPSLADLFYLSGDIALAYFFLLHLRFLRMVIRGWKRFLAAFLVLMFIIWAGVFVYGPMLSRWQRNPVEIGVNLLYETTYVILLSGAVTLTLGLIEGFLGRRWILIAVGIAVNILSAQIFFYAEWHNLYYPNSQATPISVVFDLVYIASYLILLVGLYLRWALPFPTLEVEGMLARVTRPQSPEMMVLISDAGGRAFFVDPRLIRALGYSEVGELTGEFVGNILSLRTNLDQRIIGEVQAQGQSRPRKVIVSGQLYTLYAFQEPTNGSEVYWLLYPGEPRTFPYVDERPSLETLLAQAVHRGVERETPEALQEAYLQAVSSALHVLCARFGGSEMGAEWLKQFDQVMQACQMARESGRPEDVKVVRERLRRALEWAYLMIPADQVQEAMERIERALGEPILRAAETAGLRIRVSG